jgi:hypothetical protein
VHHEGESFDMNFDTAGPLLRGIAPALQSLAELWLMALGLGLLAILVSLFRDWQQAREYRASGMAEIDQMDPYKFKQYVGWLFEQLGYTADVTKRSRDQGVDVVVTRGRQRNAVQAKRYSDTVGNDAVQQVAAGRPHYRCNAAMVVANQAFSADARALAKSNGVQRWARAVLADVITVIRHGNPEAILARLNSSMPAPVTKPRRQGTVIDKRDEEVPGDEQNRRNPWHVRDCASRY